MIVITLPDGNTRQFSGSVSGTDIASSIGAGLAKAALAMEVDGHLRDISDLIQKDATIRFITRKDPAELPFFVKTDLQKRPRLFDPSGAF